MADHGTDAGYKAHWRTGEKPCDPCLTAHNTYVRDRKRTAREKLYLKASGRAKADLVKAHRYEYHQLLQVRLAELEQELEDQLEAQADAEAVVACTATSSRISVSTLIENTTEMLGHRETPAAIATRVSKTPAALEKAFRRTGETRLADLFGAEYKRKSVVCDTDARRVVAG